MDTKEGAESFLDHAYIDVGEATFLSSNLRIISTPLVFYPLVRREGNESGGKRARKLIYL